MKLQGSELVLSASDVTTFSACAHATAQNLAVARGQRGRPPYYPDPSAEVLRVLGDAHEAAYLASLRAEHAVEEVPKHAADAAERTLDAMRRGVDVVYQGTLRGGRSWVGIPDFLHRVNRPSSLGAWSYEPSDAKLARSPKVSALLQLCFYSELLAHVQGVPPRRMSLVLGDMRVESFVTARYAAYFRYLRRSFEDALANPRATYPEPVAHCAVCDYASECEARRRADDHLSLVAGITGGQRRALELASVHTATDLSRLPLAQPLPVVGIGSAALSRIREQARLQIEGREAGALRYELLRDHVESGRGLSMLPAPSTGDLFLDFEGDPFALGAGGLEYLFGVVAPSANGGTEGTYTGSWALDHASERAAFERLVALVTERRKTHPGMHVFHYNHYETTALKRLAGRYATCVDELDVLLRARVFVDLYRAVRQSVRASVESYSIKKLEPMFGFVRDVPLHEANRCLAAFAAWVVLRESAHSGEGRDRPRAGAAAEGPPDAVRVAIEGYNRDDCLSAWRLRDWLEERRRELEGSGVRVPRPAPVEGEPSEGLAEKLTKVRACAEGLLAGVPDLPEERNAEESARYLLAHLLEWHRREDKSAWWEYFRLCDLSDEELREDRSAIGGLTYAGTVGKVKRSVVYRYRYPPQDHTLDRALELHDPRTQKAAGTLVSLDQDACVIELSRGDRSEAPHPTALIPKDVLEKEALEASLLRLGEHVRTHGLASARPFAAALALLQRSPPIAAAAGATFEDAAIRRALAIDGSLLPVQGPPGTGKTHLGGKMIEALLFAGKKIGITANSHKVIKTLLETACAFARASGAPLRAIQKCPEAERCGDALVRHAATNDEVVQALLAGEANVVAGTAWLFAREDMVGVVDVLFVDEAGQISLANVLASAPASNGIVLLGDPQQLDQPQKGLHPPGVGVSALGHILGDRATMDRDRGLFIEETWRMHPEVCNFVSEVFYEGRLRSRADLQGLWLEASDPFGGVGLRFVPVDHRCNRSESIEEVDVVERIVQRILDGGPTWTDRHGQRRPLALEDILIVAPYNAHVNLLRKRLPQAQIGTVDKFQGQQAPVVIYSMATSSPEDAPRGAEFLYSGNRFNVAISRARCSAFLVANPRLFELRCHAERHVTLVNAFCRYLELARVLTVA